LRVNEHEDLCWSFLLHYRNCYKYYGILVCLSAGFIIEIKLIIENELIYSNAAIRLTKKNDKNAWCDKNRVTKTHSLT
jgi:hypothetical protein